MSVYPRSRGEHSIRRIARFTRIGLSPLARGTLTPTQFVLRRSRFIPARAGNTEEMIREEDKPAVYPRSRGEHIALPGDKSKMSGLSPLARGTLGYLLWGGWQRRFIPARAGNTFRPGTSSLSTSVYPRSRGEHHYCFSPPAEYAGLSPLARGTLLFPQPRGALMRFIPARAGNTGLALRELREITVYPRSRGEHKNNPIFKGGLGGLSPLARGTHRVGVNDIVILRFIPARAGNTLSFLSASAFLAVYPRSRGEHTKNILLFFNNLSINQHSTNLVVTTLHY